jgi:predicted RNase H-like nuclease (RuvC/YqgF family)
MSNEEKVSSLIQSLLNFSFTVKDLQEENKALKDLIVELKKEIK